MSPGSYSLPDSHALCPLDTIIASPCFVLQCGEMALKELLTPLSLPLTVLRLSSVLCPFSSLYFSFFFCDYRSSTFLLLILLPSLSLLLYALCLLSPKVPSFSPCHEMAAKGLSVWFLLSADPISKGPGDPALAPTLLLSSPNSPQT